MRKVFLPKIKNFHQLGTLSEKLSASGRNSANTVVKSAFYVSMGAFKVIQFLSVFINFGHGANCFSLSTFVLQRGCQNCNLHFQNELFEKKTIEKEIQSYYHFRTIGEQFHALWQLFSVGLPELLATCPQKFFQEKKSRENKFCQHFRSLNGSFAAFHFFWRGCQNWLIGVHRNI